jgi:PAB-dependent poly(A)-specific ribonuclease subunit 3
MPLEHISRHYSPDVKNLVMFLISKPGPLKSIDDVIRMLGPRILNELDAAQKYVIQQPASLRLRMARDDRSCTTKS